MCTQAKSKQWFDDSSSPSVPLALILCYDSLVFKVTVFLFSLEAKRRQHLLCKAVSFSKTGWLVYVDLTFKLSEIYTSKHEMSLCVSLCKYIYIYFQSFLLNEKSTRLLLLVA